MFITNLKQLLQDGTKMLVNCLLGLSHQRSPDMGHGFPNSGIRVVLVAVQLGDKLGNVWAQLLSCQFSY